MRRWCLLLFALVLVLPFRLHAQGGGWSAWLYNPNGTMTHVRSDGIVRDLALPTAAGQDFPRRVAVSPGGEWVAYMTGNAQLNAHRLIIYDLSGETVAADYVTTGLFADSLSFHAAPSIFSADGTALALGLAPVDGLWRVIILNTRNGATMAELRADSPAASDAGLPSGIGIVPVVRHYYDGVVAFDLLAAAEADEWLGSYIWDPIANQVTPNDRYPGDSVALLAASGDIVVTGYESQLPALGPAVANAAFAYSPATGRRATFYTDSTQALARPHFVQNGELVLLNGLSADGTTRWTAVARGGGAVGSATFDALDLFGLANGFIYLTPDDARVLMLADTRNGIDAGQPVGMAPAGVELQLAWAGDLNPTTTAYAPWLDLLDPVSLAQATQVALEAAAVVLPPTELPPTAEPTAGFFVAPPPEFLPTPAAFTTQLQVEDRAVVTRAGHAAGLRTQPDDEAPAIILLYTDMLVDILEGPEITDGYIWWRVQTVGETPRTGWAVEGAQGQAWLVPVGR